MYYLKKLNGVSIQVKASSMIFTNFPITRTCNIVKGLSLTHIVYIQDANFKEPVRKFTLEEEIKLKLQYYNADVHRSAFVLPQFARKVKHEKKSTALVSHTLVHQCRFKINLFKLFPK